MDNYTTCSYTCDVYTHLLAPEIVIEKIECQNINTKPYKKYYAMHCSI